jgi:hypothetical protein
MQASSKQPAAVGSEASECNAEPQAEFDKNILQGKFANTILPPIQIHSRSLRLQD